jgi:hypothetical protein
MEPADGIRRLGFSRWYERQLIESHAWFVSGVLCLVAIAACVEEVGQRGSALGMAAYALLGFAAVVIGVYAVTRYGQILAQAEEIGERATCRSCGAYARFRLVSPIRVRCRRCDSEWRLID